MLLPEVEYLRNLEIPWEQNNTRNKNFKGIFLNCSLKDDGYSSNTSLLCLQYETKYWKTIILILTLVSKSLHESQERGTSSFMSATSSEKGCPVEIGVQCRRSSRKHQPFQMNSIPNFWKPYDSRNKNLLTSIPGKGVTSDPVAIRMFFVFTFSCVPSFLWTVTSFIPLI